MGVITMPGHTTATYQIGKGLFFFSKNQKSLKKLLKNLFLDIFDNSFISEVFSDIVRDIAKFANIMYNLLMLEL